MAENSGKFVCYYRVSTKRQGRSGLGLEAQRAAVQNYLNGGNWQIVSEHTEVESGRNSNRPVLEQALAAARLHRATLVVAKMDRLTRNVAFLTRLLEAGVDLRFVDLPIAEGPAGRLQLHIMASVAQFEVEQCSIRIKAALVQAKRRGVVLGGDRGNVPTKAQRQRATAAVKAQADARAADVMPSIRTLQQSGAASLRAIAKGLNDQSIPTARGGTWSATQVMNVLRRA